MDEASHPHSTDREDCLRASELAKSLHLAEAIELGELYLIDEDLRTSYRSMELYFDRYIDATPDNDEHVIKLSLFRDSVIQFTGCFSRKSNVKPDPSEVYEDFEGADKLFQWFQDVRDAFVAHNFGPYRQHEVVAILEWNEERDRVRLSGIGDAMTRYSGPSKAERDQVLSFIAIGGRFVRDRIERAKSKLHIKLLEVGPDELYRYPEYKAAIPSSDEIRITRERFRKKRERVSGC